MTTPQATYRQAVAQVGRRRPTPRAKALDVEFTRVIAPAAGRASDRKVSVGNYVTAGTTVLTTIVSLDPIYFIFTGSEAVYLKYQRANRAGTRPSSRVAPNPVDIRLADENGYRWHGRMEFVDNAIDQGSGTIRGRAVVPNPDGFLTPGMFGHMRLLGSGAYQALLVPEEAVVTDQTRKTVLVVGPDGKVAQRVVETRADRRRPARRPLGPRADRPRHHRRRPARPGRSTGHDEAGQDRAARRPARRRRCRASPSRPRPPATAAPRWR